MTGQFESAACKMKCHYLLKELKIIFRITRKSLECFSVKFFNILIDDLKHLVQTVVFPSVLWFGMKNVMEVIGFPVGC